MPRSKKSKSRLTAAGRAHLAAELAAVGRLSRHAHLRRADRVAVTYGPRRRGGAALPEGPVELGGFRLYALSYRWRDDGDRGPRPRVTLAVYRAVADRPGGGRIGFRCVRALDVADRRDAAEVLADAELARTAVVLHQAVEGAGRGEFGAALELPAFYYGFDPRRPPTAPSTCAPSAWSASEVAIEGLRAWPASLFVRPADGQADAPPAAGEPGPPPEAPVPSPGGAMRERMPIPSDRVPVAVFAALSHLVGRRMRNPALRVLQKHGVVPAALGYKAWRETVSRRTETGRAYQDPRDDPTAAGRLRRAIEAYASASPARERALLGDLRSACRAVGLAGPDATVDGDALAELLDNPWTDPPALATSARVQLVEVPGAATARYANEEAEVDLSDLGAATSRFEGPPSWSVRQVLRRRSGWRATALATGLVG